MRRLSKAVPIDWGNGEHLLIWGGGECCVEYHRLRHIVHQAGVVGAVVWDTRVVLVFL